MFKFKVYNSIAEEGIKELLDNGFQKNDDEPNAILLRSHKLDCKDMDNNLKCIARAGTGTNNIPVEEATKRGIVVFNTPGANSNAVKELVLCGMLLASRGIIEGSLFTKSLASSSSTSINDMMEKQKKQYKGNELKGKTLGIIGLGSVGSLLAQAAEVLGMKIIGYDPYISVDGAWMLPKEVEKADDIKYLLQNSDYVSLHIPLNKDTKHFISKETLKFFKKGIKLINLSRGDIVNNLDVINALNNQILSKFITDFPTKELIERVSKKNDVILLPHLGASTKEAEINCAIMAAQQTKNFLANGVIVNSINFPKVKLGRTTDFRLVIIHKDEPGMIGNIAQAIASENLNIKDMINKSRNEIAITLIDLEDNASQMLIEKINNIKNVISIRVC